MDYIDGGEHECDSRHVFAAISIVDQMEAIFLEKRRRKAEVQEREVRFAAERAEQAKLLNSQQDIVLPQSFSQRNQT